MTRHNISKTWEAFSRATQVKSYEFFTDKCMGSGNALAIAFVEALGLRNASTAVKPVDWFILDLATKRGLRILEGSTTAGAATEYVPRTENLIKVFECLRVLSLSIPGAQDIISACELGRVQRLLRAARNVRMLDLAHGNVDEYLRNPESSEKPDFAPMPSSSSLHVIYPHLQDLRIEARVPAQPFSDFLRLHASTLSRLRIRKSYSDDWNVILCAIAKHFRLDRIQLYELIDGLRIPSAANGWNRGEKPWQRHFMFESIFLPGGCRVLQGRTPPVSFVEAMAKFFDGGGDEGLPREYHNEQRDMDAAHAARMARIRRRY